MNRRYGKCMGMAIMGLLMLATKASACGVCIEDTVAVTYDHAVVRQARARHHVVVFTAIAGNADSGTLVRNVKAAAVRAPGVARDSVRTATAPAALSFAVDPGIAAPETAIAAIERSASGVKLSVLRIVR